MVEWPEATSRAAEGLEGMGSVERVSPSGEGPQKFVSILDLKMASFGALWVAKIPRRWGMHPPLPLLDPPLPLSRPRHNRKLRFLHCICNMLV